MSESTSISLIQHCGRADNTRYWTEFLSVYLPFIDRQLRRFGLRDADANDVRQNVLQILVGELPTFHHNGNKGAFRKWLKLIISNQLRAFFRRHRSAGRSVGAGEMELLQTLADPASDLSRWWDHEFAVYTTERIMSSLTTRFDQSTLHAFRRQFLDDATPDEVAKETGKTKPAVIAAKCRVLRALREQAALLHLDDADAI